MKSLSDDNRCCTDVTYYMHIGRKRNKQREKEVEEKKIEDLLILL